MKQPVVRLSFLEVFYLILFILLFSIVFIIPLLINDNVALTDALIIDEEIAEGILLSVLLLLSLVLSYLYRKEYAKQQRLIKTIEFENLSAIDKLDSAFKYIGKINVQIQEIRSIFNHNRLYPETKSDFKKSLMFFSERVLGIVNADWVLFRIIDNASQQTVSEHFKSRAGINHAYPQISNKQIINNSPAGKLTSILSNHGNINFLVSCNLPLEAIDQEQDVLINLIVNELTMLFIIFSSTYYNNGKD